MNKDLSLSEDIHPPHILRAESAPVLEISRRPRRKPSFSEIYVSDPGVDTKSTSVKDTLFVSQPLEAPPKKIEVSEDKSWIDVFKPRTKFEATMGAKLR